MATLAAFGPLVGHLPQNPLIDLVATAHILGVELPHLFGDVHHDGPGLEDADRLAPAQWLMVHHGWHAVVRADLQKSLLELISAADVAGHKVVGQATFFQQDGHFLAVGGGPVVQIDHAVCLLV
jgi:hypothetical protein